MKTAQIPTIDIMLAVDRAALALSPHSDTKGTELEKKATHSKLWAVRLGASEQSRGNRR